MSRATGKVGNSKFCEVVHLQCRITRRRVNQVFPLVLRLAIRIVVDIDASHGVLHHILHNPVGREYLRSRSNLVGIILALLCKSLVLAVGDIELIEPADKFGRVEIIVGDKFSVIKHTHKTTFRQNILWQEQLCVVGNSSEALVDDRILMTISHYEQGKLLVGLAVVVKEFHQFVMHVGCHLRHSSLSGLAHNDRHTHLFAFVSQDRRNKALLLHDADSHEAVEPCVGSLFSHLLDAASVYVVV